MRGERNEHGLIKMYEREEIRKYEQRRGEMTNKTAPPNEVRAETGGERERDKERERERERERGREREGERE